MVDSRTAPSCDVEVNSDCVRLNAVTAGLLLLGRVRRSHVSALTPTAAPIDPQGLAGRRPAPRPGRPASPGRRVGGPCLMTVGPPAAGPPQGTPAAPRRTACAPLVAAQVAASRLRRA